MFLQVSFLAGILKLVLDGGRRPVSMIRDLNSAHLEGFSKRKQSSVAIT
jgi:hypothetical protein